MKNNLPKVCYWCGENLPLNNTSKEHVPPFTFFPKGHRENLMTVPSCLVHNNNLSYLDEKFQFFIKAFKTNEIAIDDLNTRVKRGFERKEKQSFVRSLEENSKSGTIDGKPHWFLPLEQNEAELFIEKIVRGLYFYHKEKPAKGIIQSISKRIIYENGVNTIAGVDFLKEDLNSDILSNGDYKNPKVFKYQYLDFRDMFVVFMQFYDDVEFIGWKYPENFSFD